MLETIIKYHIIATKMDMKTFKKDVEKNPDGFNMKKNGNLA